MVCPGVIETPLLDKGNPDDLPDAGVPDIRAMLTAMVGQALPGASLAADVLDGVARNRPLIVAPRHARLIWAAYRLAPATCSSTRAPSGSARCSARAAAAAEGRPAHHPPTRR